MNDQSKKSTGRPVQPIKRMNAIGIRLTDAERFVIEQKAERAGMTLTAYVRHMAFHGKVIAHLTEEDRQIVRKLIELNN